MFYGRRRGVPTTMLNLVFTEKINPTVNVETDAALRLYNDFELIFYE
ncbi:hypothetical protein ACE4RU_02530 [Actinobacillus seminis]